MILNYSAYFTDSNNGNQILIFSHSKSQFKSKLIYYLSYRDIDVDGRSSLKKVFNICYDYLDDFHYSTGD